MDPSHKPHPEKKVVTCRPRGHVLSGAESVGPMYRWEDRGLLGSSHLAQFESRSACTHGLGTRAVGRVRGDPAPEGGDLGVSLPAQGEEPGGPTQLPPRGPTDPYTYTLKKKN